jgi:hypothetical protein
MSQCVLPVVPRDLLFLSHFSLRSDLLYCMHLYEYNPTSYCKSVRFSINGPIYIEAFYHFIFNMIFLSYTFFQVAVTGNDRNTFLPYFR